MTHREQANDAWARRHLGEWLSDIVLDFLQLAEIMK
jgi:hypothetical protein